MRGGGEGEEKDDDSLLSGRLSLNLSASVSPSTSYDPRALSGPSSGPVHLLSVHPPPSSLVPTGPVTSPWPPLRPSLRPVPTPPPVPHLEAQGIPPHPLTHPPTGWTAPSPRPPSIPEPHPSRHIFARVLRSPSRRPAGDRVGVGVGGFRAWGQAGSKAEASTAETPGGERQMAPRPRSRGRGAAP